MGHYVKHIQDHAGGRKSFRRQIPSELKSYFNKTQFRVSIGFPDSPDFLSRYQQASAQYDRDIALARKKHEGTYDQLDAPTIAYLAEAFRVEELEQDEASRWDTTERAQFKAIAADLTGRGVAYQSGWQGRESVRWALKARENLEASLPEYMALRANGDMDGIISSWRDEAIDLAEARGLTINSDDHAAIAQLCRALNDAAISAGTDRLKRLDGEQVETPPEPPKRAAKAPKVALGPSVPILATYDAYALASGMTIRVRDEWRLVIQRLIKHLGHDDAGLLTAPALRGWRDFIASEPARKGKVRAPVTVRNKYIAPIKAMLEWAVQEGLLETNVADKVTVTVPRSVKTRQRAFTADEAKAILTATLAPISPNMSKGHRLARRWIPWLCAYTGGRVNEYSQLRAEDVREVDGIWALNITPEAGTVKAKEARMVPLHPHLIEQGFLEIVTAQGSGPLFYDPASVRRAGEGNRHIDKVGERLGQWVRKEVGITDPGIKPNHAWRHLFKTLSIKAGIEERTADAIQGHAPASVGRSYGGVPLETKAEAIRRIPRFETD
jgi:integrase